MNYVWGHSSSTLAPRPIPPPTYLTDAPRIVAIGDLHGDFTATVRVLRLVGAIDSQNQWIGGKLVVVQVGDQLDRGDGERSILDLLETLADQAHVAGGAIYVLNGNHEVMNVEQDFRYVTDGGWREFSNTPLDEASPEVWSYPEQQRGRVAAFLPAGPYARILGGHNTVCLLYTSDAADE